MLGFHFVNNIDPPFSAHYLIIRTNFLNTGTHFHADHPLSAGDTLLLKIINLGAFYKLMQSGMKIENRKRAVFDILRVRTGDFRPKCAVL